MEGVFCQVVTGRSVSAVGEVECSSIAGVCECIERDRDRVEADGFGGLWANGRKCER